MMKVGIVGAGTEAIEHLDLLRGLPEFKVAGIFDPCATSKSAGNESDIRFYTSLKELIEASEVIDILRTAPGYFEHATNSVRAGKHVFFHHPAKLELAEAKKLAILISEARIVAHAGNTERANPAYLSVRPLVTRPLFISCEHVTPYDAGDLSVVRELMVRDIDLVLDLVRSPVRRISATGAAVLGATHDIAEARLEFNNGCVATLGVSRVANHHAHKMNIFEDHHILSLDLQNKAAFRSRPAAAHDGAKFLHREKLALASASPLTHELSLFAKAIQKQETEAATFDQAYNALKVADEVMTAINGKL